MSASDAAPLPRLGEVYFDVRGESRSMRLSWYADTGVAVFSIWQGGTCTGTFRLPIADLPRMVEALQRGPHARDDPATGGQPASREPRRTATSGPPAAPGVPRPARPPRPEFPDSDIETGQTTAAIYLPPVESDLTGYQAEPPLPGYSGEPPGGYRDETAARGGQGDYQAGPPPGYRGKATRRRRGPPPAPQFSGGPAQPPTDEDLAGGHGEYAAEPPAAGFPGEYAAEPPAPGFTGGRGSRRRSRDPGGSTGGYPAGPLEPDLPHDPADGYPEVPAGRGSGGYHAPLAPEYPGEAARGYRDEPAAAGYPAEPADGYLVEETLAPGYPENYQDGPVGAEPGVPDDPRAAELPGGHRRDGRGGRYPAGRAGRGNRGSGRAGPASGHYPPPAPSGYPEDQDYQDYPEELPATEYGSPARPYVTDQPDTDQPFADDQPERRKPRGRRRAEPAPDSFPYGPPPTDDGPRQRGRSPGRH